MTTYSITRQELHQELAKWPAYIRETDGLFWHEKEVLDTVIPVLLAAVTDVCLSFLAEFDGEA
jgi:hypothetical protein